MKVTKVEKKSDTRYTVEVDGEYFGIFDQEILADNQIRPGISVEPELLEGLKDQAEHRRARERAYYLLSYRDHSSKELYDKLCRNVSPQTAASTVEKMQQLGFLDDARYADKLADYYLNTKLWSRRKSLFELQRRGIDRQTAEEALDSCGVEAYDQILSLIEQKYWRRLDGDPKNEKTVMDALARMGYSYSDIRSAVQDYETENGIEKDEEDQWQYE